MIYDVYIIFSANIDRYYVGYTHELDKRIRNHNSGLSSYTQRGIPWELIKFFECESKRRSHSVGNDNQETRHKKVFKSS